MTWNIWQQFIELNGNPVAGAQVEVRRMADNGLATIASDKSGTVLGNPFPATDVGFAEFYAQAGLYKITASKDGVSFSLVNVALGEAAGRDVGIGANDVLDKAAADTLYATVRRYNVAAGAPSATDDATQGYTAGSQWLNTATQELYQSFSSTAGAADWRVIDTGITLGTMAVLDEGDGAHEFRNNQAAEEYFASIASFDFLTDMMNSINEGLNIDDLQANKLYLRTLDGWSEADLGTVAPLDVDTDANLTANSDALIPSQKAVKAYVDNNAGGGGLDPTADESISGIWDLQNGVNINGAKYGQLNSNPSFPATVAEYAQTFSNASSGGALEIDSFRGLFNEDSTSIAVGFTNSVDTNTMVANGSVEFTNYRMMDFVNGVYSYDYSGIEKGSNGLFKSSYAASSGVGDNSVGFSLEADTNGSTATIKQSGSDYIIETPIDGRILTEEVTASRALTKADIGKILICTGSSDITITVPVGLQDKTFNCVIQNKTDSNVVTIADDATSDIFNRYGEYDIALGGVVSLLPTLETDEYTLVGETV